MSNPLPRCRELHLSIQHVGQETLIYDEQTHRAFCLNAVAAAVWSRCDGATPSAEIAASSSLALAMPITDELVQLSLAELLRDGLLEPDTTLTTNLSRRDALLKLAARSAMMLPVVAAVATPTAAQAYNGCVNCNNTDPKQENTDIFATPTPAVR